jgi:hypothetical protein
MELHENTPDVDDVLVWPDGFWCFRAENSAAFLRSSDYRELRCGTTEWESLLSHDKDAVRRYRCTSHL